VNALRYVLRDRGVRAGLGLCAAGALLLAAALLYWWPTHRAHQQLRADIRDGQRALADLAHAAELAGAYERAAREVAALDAKLGYAGGQAKLVESLGAAARRRGIRVLSESYEESREPQAGHVTLLLNLALAGDYLAVRAFLRDVPDLPAWCAIREVRLDREESTSSVKATVRLAVFRRPAARASGGEGA
jgi:Tfp pilus assembly protein PilO